MVLTKLEKYSCPMCRYVQSGIVDVSALRLQALLQEVVECGRILALVTKLLRLPFVAVAITEIVFPGYRTDRGRRIPE